MSKHKVVIVGGGFGGVKTALELADDRRFHVTLVSNTNDFLVYGSLYHTATGGTKEVASIPLTEIFAGKGVHLVQDQVTGLNREKRFISTSVGHKVFFDALVLAMGVQTNYFHIGGLKEYSFGIKTPEDAEEFKRHLHQQMTDDKKLDLNYVVIGGGPTGVELAGVLPNYLRKIAKQHGLPKRAVHVDLIEAAPRLLPNMPRDVSRMVKRQLRREGVHVHLNKAVQAQTADSLMVDNKPIRSHTVIWTAGVTNNPFFVENGFQLAKNNKVRVDHFLQSEAGIYVIGDNADTPYSGMAQVALEDGKYVAHNLIRLANKINPLPYKAKKPIYVMPAGPKWAAVLWGPVRIYGILGWWLRRAADLIAYHDYEPWLLATKRWFAEIDEEDLCTTCNNKLERVMYESGEVS